MAEVPVVEFMLRHSKRREFLDPVRPGVPQVGERLRRLHRELVRGIGGDPPERWREVPLKPDGDVLSGLADVEREVVVDVAHVLTTSVRDHLLSLAILAEGDAPTRTLLAVSRVLLEASCMVRFVMKPDVKVEVRVVRAANVMLDSLREEANDASGDGRVELLRKRDELRDRLVARGYAATPAGTQLKPGNDPITIQCEAGESGPWLFRTLSSSIHSFERGWIRAFTGAELIPDGPGGRRIMLGFWVPAVEVCIEGITDMQTFYGLRGDPLETATVMALRDQVSFASGDHDDEIWARMVEKHPSLREIWDPANPPALAETNVEGESLEDGQRG